VAINLPLPFIASSDLTIVPNRNYFLTQQDGQVLDELRFKRFVAMTVGDKQLDSFPSD
jgi:hypothetical protein